MGNYTIGAVKDYGAQDFNSGVLLINAKKWREENITEKIWQSVQNSESLRYADQGLLNDYFSEDYLRLSDKYNHLIGTYSLMFYNQLSGWSAEKINQVSRRLADIKNTIVYHYTTAIKPWKFPSNSLYKDKWWKYYSLNWDNLHNSIEFSSFNKDVFIFTNSSILTDIEQLVKQLPKVRFNIAAYTDMAFTLLRLVQYKNVRVYPAIIGKDLNTLINNSSAMLDITNGPDNEITKRFAKTGKPIIGYRQDKFAGIIPEDSNYELVNNFDEMVEKIKEA